MPKYDRTASASARWRIDNIIPVPDNLKVNKKYLGTMNNSEFVSTFKELQNFIIKIYEEIEKSPYEWGYKDENRDVGATANNRISDFLYAIASNGILENGVLTVNTEDFNKAVRTHKKIDLIINGLKKLGLNIDGFDKKVISFIVSYPNNAHIIEVLYQYAEAQDQEFFPVKAIQTEQYLFPSFSYRWVEDPIEQKYETIFHVKMDLSSDTIRGIQNWLHQKADEYGYKIKKDKPFDKGCVFYQKGSKNLIHVGDKIKDNGESAIWTKAIFRNVFTSHPEKIKSLADKIPGVFGGSKFENGVCIYCNGAKKPNEPCSMRILYYFDGKQYNACAYRAFEFNNFSLDVFKDIFYLFLIENKIK